MSLVIHNFIGNNTFPPTVYVQKLSDLVLTYIRYCEIM